jgi:uncharacterized protein
MAKTSEPIQTYTQTSADWVKALKLAPHPEGGFYREIHRSPHRVQRVSPNGDPSTLRQASTCIYYLLEGDQVSKLHRLDSEETWHFHLGEPLSLFLLYPDGRLEEKRLGPDIESGESLFAIIPDGIWFGARLPRVQGFSLVTCTVSPGFEFQDFEIATGERLLETFPEHKEIIQMLS